MVLKPYQHVPIQDCNDPLVAIPIAVASPCEPHPYVALGAPYGDHSPFWLRRGVVERLAMAAEDLARQRPGWRIEIFDAYRPVTVQQFMVDYTFCELATVAGLDPTVLAAATAGSERWHVAQEIRDRVAEFWATPSQDPATPPPHSTGAALDVTLLDDTGTAVEMGSPIDECSPRSYPNHFADRGDAAARRVHAYRQLLATVMAGAGFAQHPNEWWHFSWGDQLWAWQTGAAIAPYGGCP